MFCYNCGTKLPQNDSCCIQCGTITVVPQSAPSQSTQSAQYNEKRLDVGLIVLTLIGWVFMIISSVAALPCFFAGIVLALLRRNTKNTTAALVFCCIGFALLIVVFIIQEMPYKGIL